MNCPFCERTEVVHFSEHYYFCTFCSAIWTNLIIQEGCEHIPPNTRKTPIPYIVRKPWFKSLDLGTHVFKDRCSECGATIKTSGW